MKKQGEIISFESTTALVRIYKTKNDDLEPTSLTVNATVNSKDVSVGDFVVLEMNMFFVRLFTISGYILPFFTSIISYIISGLFTKNIIIVQSVFLITLALTYVFVSLLSNVAYFKNLSFCTITDIDK